MICSDFKETPPACLKFAKKYNKKVNTTPGRVAFFCTTLILLSLVIFVLIQCGKDYLSPAENEGANEGNSFPLSEVKKDQAEH